MFDFSAGAQKVWATDSIEEKKDHLLDMVNHFMYKGKYDEIANGLFVTSSLLSLRNV